MSFQYLSVVQNIQKSIKYKTQKLNGHFHGFQKLQNFSILKIFNKPFFILKTTFNKTSVSIISEALR